MLSVWDAFDKIAPEKQDVLTSEEMPQRISDFQGQLGVSDQEIEKLSILIRKYFFGTLDGAQFSGEVRTLFGQKTEAEKENAIKYIQKEILELKPKPKIVEKENLQETPQNNSVVIYPLLQALSKYEGLGNQMVTNERIHIKSQPEPVRPSLFNWLKCYRDELGIGQHNSVQRGQFLFRSENGRRLNPEERERINLILKSVEENFPLQIDARRQEIIFPKFEFESVSERPAQESRDASPRIELAFGGATFAKGPSFDAHGENAEKAPAPLPPRETKSSVPNGNRFTVTREAPMGKLLGVKAFQETEESPAGTMSFSSSHTLPAEQEEKVQATGQNQGAKLKPREINPFHIRPVSLGEEKKSRKETSRL
ncbi:MAG: hypothetical protein A2808_01980 [Candidatus Moranbacteria bacterium RIFCSPHIGHO2_01_FULL_55_24]|nr:MAG: hypothetical protein A2808_01980 [Candidatus Moranbacteria bacterium RIFCSPHIGHO2_01_FULL_55_24]